MAVNRMYMIKKQNNRGLIINYSFTGSQGNLQVYVLSVSSVSVLQFFYK